MSSASLSSESSRGRGHMPTTLRVSSDLFAPSSSPAAFRSLTLTSQNKPPRRRPVLLKLSHKFEMDSSSLLPTQLPDSFAPKLV